MTDDEQRAMGRRLRAARGTVPQRLIGAAIGVDVATISRWEHGHRGPSAAQLRALCDRLGVSADWVLRGVAP